MPSINRRTNEDSEEMSVAMSIDRPGQDRCAVVVY